MTLSVCDDSHELLHLLNTEFNHYYIRGGDQQEKRRGKQTEKSKTVGGKGRDRERESG